MTLISFPLSRAAMGLGAALAVASADPTFASSLPQSQVHPALNRAHEHYSRPQLPFDEAEAETNPDDSLIAAIAETFASNPELAARRYDLRANDDEVGIAMAQSRPQLQAQISGGYDLTLPGSITQSSRSLSDRLNNPNIERNDVTSQLLIDQPLFTGGRASSAVRSALAGSKAGRDVLRGIEGDLLLDLVAAYSDVRRDTRALAIRRTNLRVLETTLDEVTARRDAGELTRTDIAQAESQLLAAQVQLNAAEAQVESSRAAFTAIVGREPGNLAPEPDLPGLPNSADEAFAMAELANPDLAAAISTARASRERIAAAQAEGRPSISLRGSAGTNGPAVPFDRFEHDVTFAGRITLSVPLFFGGLVRSQVAQARNRESADTLRIEATRRQMVASIINAWNQWVTATRNAKAQEVQVQAARIFYEGTFEEYREGLRSTFDVLFAQNNLRETEIALLASKRDSYVAKAVLLRRLGQLEVGKLLANGPTYDPDLYLRNVRQRASVPWGGLVRAIDKVGAPGGSVQAIEQPAGSLHGPSPAQANTPSVPSDLLRGGPFGPAGIAQERSSQRPKQ